MRKIQWWEFSVVLQFVETLSIWTSSAINLGLQSSSIRTAEFSIVESVALPRKKLESTLRRFQFGFDWCFHCWRIVLTINSSSKFSLNWPSKTKKISSIDSIFFFRRNLQNKKFFKSNEPFPVESYLRLLDLIDRAPPSLSKELRSTLSQSAAQLSVNR